MDGILSSLALASAIKYLVLLRNSKQKPAHARYVGTVSEIWNYPVKSARGQLLEEAECEQVALKDTQTGVYDRTWMIITESYVRVNAKVEPKVAAIDAKVTKDELELNASGMETLTIPIVQKGKSFKIMKTAEAIDCGDAVADWLQRYLKRPGIRLVYSGPDMYKRRVNEGELWWSLLSREEDRMNLADVSTYMLMSQASIDDINKRVSTKVGPGHFRPNIVIDGKINPYEEDEWEEVFIGENVKMTKMLVDPRCVITMVDPATGIMSKEGEPLKTLLKYRRVEPSIPEKACVGVFHNPDRFGTIKKGDPVYAIFSDSKNF